MVTRIKHFVANLNCLIDLGVDIKDIPKVNDKDFSITLNAYFIVKWRDQRLIVMTSNRTRSVNLL